MNKLRELTYSEIEKLKNANIIADESDLEDYAKKFIIKFGVDNIIKLDGESEGIFSSKTGKEKNLAKFNQCIKCFDWDKDIKSLLSIYGDIFSERWQDEPALKCKIEQYETSQNYNDFKNIIITYLSFSRVDIYHIDYDYIGGNFRKENPSIFIDSSDFSAYNIPETEKNAIIRRFYNKGTTIEDIVNYSQIFKNKDIRRCSSLPLNFIKLIKNPKIGIERG